MVDKEIKLQFFKTLECLEQPEGAFWNTDLSDCNFSIELKYPRQAFISDILKILSNYNSFQQTDITGLFGFITDKNIDGVNTIKGYPSVENLNKDDDISAVYSKIFHHVKLFTQENKVLVKDNKPLSDYLNIIVKALPEFLTVIGTIQHKTHSYSVDIHTLKVLQEVVKNQKYKNLPVEDRRVLQIAVLLHDITKKEGEIDKSHPACGAKDARFILNKLDLSAQINNKICLIIKNHDWLERYNKGLTSAIEFAHILKDENNFLMETILAEADLKAVKRDGEFYERYKDILHKGIEEIGAIISKHKSAA